MENEVPRIDVSLIPEYQARQLTEPLIDIVTEYFKQPGVQEKYELWLVELKH